MKQCPTLVISLEIESIATKALLGGQKQITEEGFWLKTTVALGDGNLATSSAVLIPSPFNSAVHKRESVQPLLLNHFVWMSFIALCFFVFLTHLASLYITHNPFSPT